MSKYTQDNQICAIETVLGKDKIFLDEGIGVQYKSSLGEPFIIKAVCRTIDTPLSKSDTEKLVLSNTTIRIGRGKPYYLNGQILSVSSWTDSAHSSIYYFYALSIVPAFSLTNYSFCSKQFFDKTPKDVIEETLKGHGVKPDINITGPMVKAAVTTQYRESDYSFVLRTLEHYGVTVWFTFENGKHIMKCTDRNSCFVPHVKFPKISWIPNGKNKVSIRIRKKLLPCIGNWTVDGFDLEKGKYKEGKAKASNSDNKYKASDFMLCSSEEDPGSFAKIRKEEEETKGEVYEGHIDGALFHSGETFTLSDHNDSSFNQEYLITSTKAIAGINKEKIPYLRTFFTAIAKNIPFRPVRRTAVPRIYGTQAAVVVGKDKSKEVSVGKEGVSVSVRFLWDLSSKDDDITGFFIPVGQPWAGNKRGTCYIPRIGDYVFITFINGDPSYPIITGSAYLGENEPPVKLPDDDTKTVLLATKGINGTDGFLVCVNDKKDEPSLDFDSPKEKTKHNFFFGGDELNFESSGKTKAQFKKELYLKTLKPVEATAEDQMTAMFKKGLDMKSDGPVNMEIAKDLAITANGLTAEAKGQFSVKGAGIVLESSGDSSIKGQNVVSEAQSNISLKGMNISQEASMKWAAKGMQAGIASGMGAFLALDAMAAIKGAIAQINSGGSAPSPSTKSAKSAQSPQKPQEPKEEIKDLTNEYKSDKPGDLKFQLDTTESTQCAGSSVTISGGTGDSDSNFIGSYEKGTNLQLDKMPIAGIEEDFYSNVSS